MKGRKNGRLILYEVLDLSWMKMRQQMTKLISEYFDNDGKVAAGVYISSNTQCYFIVYHIGEDRQPVKKFFPNKSLQYVKDIAEDIALQTYYGEDTECLLKKLFSRTCSTTKSMVEK
jgi:hypothetical protein